MRHKENQAATVQFESGATVQFESGAKRLRIENHAFSG
jgi:hypothetical protein